MKKDGQGRLFFIYAGVGGTIRQGCTGKDASQLFPLAKWKRALNFFV